MTVLCGMALRQTTGFIESLLRLIGLDWDVPDFSTLSRRQETLKVNIPYRGSDGRFRKLPQTQCRHLTGGNPPSASKRKHCFDVGSDFTAPTASPSQPS